MISSLKIGAFTFAVVFPQVVTKDGESMDGHLWHSQTTIEIDNNLAAQPKVQTLLHEIIHEIGIQAGQEMTEGMVDSIAFGIYQVMRDNPELVRMITKG
jgi:hypothetical protein